MKTFKKITLFGVLFLLFTLFSLKTSAQIYTLSSNINIDWQVVNSYTPPFYEGKALAGESSSIKAIASVEVMTPVGTLDPSKLFYAWRYNDYYSHIYSKTGGNIIYFTLDDLQSTNVLELKVYENNRQENLLAEKIIRISPRKSEAILYRKNNNPIITYSNAINKRFQNYEVYPNETFDILAEPYYFSVKNPKENKLSYVWSVNGIPGNTNYTNTFSYKAPGTSFRDFGIGLKIENSTQILQSSESLLNFILIK